jgi:hypothetical protein
MVLHYYKNLHNNVNCKIFFRQFFEYRIFIFISFLKLFDSKKKTCHILTQRKAWDCVWVVLVSESVRILE